ncbi:kinase-like domain-containing protein [Glomus cerebriforme]|uniref:Kinase-like domain-containing protein n=1 Tax=Glomus cerebriforme TaxID=658196 RepID=A0A397SLA7_9GLOM|nr:kinase-like domain-containing protein [Glomus cerebriforme]
MHRKQKIHCDIHTGNVLFLSNSIDEFGNCITISDMGLCGEVENIDETKIYGVMPYVAPEILRGNSYTQSADIYSFGMIMYFVATGRQPFADFAHDELLALEICKGRRPEIDEQKCWDLHLDNRPNVTEIEELILLFCKSYENIFAIEDIENDEIEKQFKKAEEYRKANISSFKNNQSVTHPQAIYTSRILNPFTKNLHNTECLDCEIID